VISTIWSVRLSAQVAPGTEAEIRALLTRCGTIRMISRAAEQSFLMKEVVPLSQSLSALGAAGLESPGLSGPGEWRSAKLEDTTVALIEEAKKPKAQVLLMVAPSVQKLVEAAAGQTVNARSL